MKSLSSFFLALFILFISPVFSQCPSTQVEVRVEIVPDNYPQEISWVLTDNHNDTLMFGDANSDSICIDTSSCLYFTIYDSYGDGITGNGYYQVSYGGIIVVTGSNYDFSESTNINCSQGFACEVPNTVNTGVHTTQTSNHWYTFSPSSNGMYEISTCNQGNTCSTTLWVYEDCDAIINESNEGTVFHNQTSSSCGSQAIITAAMYVGETYLIRVGDSLNDCLVQNQIGWSLQYNGAISGCTDNTACNYNPLAGIDDGSCAYTPDPICGGPDLVLDQQDLISSLSMDNYSSISGNNCRVAEGCLNGYGERRILRFSTKIDNIGNLDYYIGDPQNNPDQFSFNNCHGHPHYEGYADYVLFKQDGTSIPIGRKNGFCVIDLSCPQGISAQYGCSNMGITAGCSDIYGAYLSCQWIDITDVDTGDYTLAVVVNWDYDADALGRHELDYSNNWAQVCLNIFEQNGEKNFSILPNCAPYTDCLGDTNGNATIDCNGICDGPGRRGDLNGDTNRTLTDVQEYISRILSGSIQATACNDVNLSGNISVWDAAMVNNCALNTSDMACNFPRSVVNDSQTVSIRLDSIDLLNKTIEVSILNPSSKLIGYEFDVSGINIIQVDDMTANDFEVELSSHDQKVIGLSVVDSILGKSQTYQKLCKIHFDYATLDSVCLVEIVDMVNHLYESVATQITGSCLDVSTITSSKNLVHQNKYELFPNPADQKLNLKLPQHAQGTIELSIVNVLGQTIYTQQINKKGIFEINTKEFSKGNYILRIDDNISTQQLNFTIVH